MLENIFCIAEQGSFAESTLPPQEFHSQIGCKYEGVNCACGLNWLSVIFMWLHTFLAFFSTFERIFAESHF